jgi:hypothetical protein
MPRPLKTEQEHHRQGFERYYALGESRSYERVAAEMSVSPAAVKLWGRSFQWRSRVRSRDLEVARRLADRASTTVSDTRSKRRKILDLAIMKLAKAVAEDQVRYTAGDLEKLLRLEQQLADLEQTRELTLSASPEAIAAYLNQVTSATLKEVRRIFWRMLLDLYPDYRNYGCPEEPTLLREGVQDTPYAAVSGAMEVRGGDIGDSPRVLIW